RSQTPPASLIASVPTRSLARRRVFRQSLRTLPRIRRRRGLSERCFELFSTHFRASSLSRFASTAVRLAIRRSLGLPGSSLTDCNRILLVGSLEISHRVQYSPQVLMRLRVVTTALLDGLAIGYDSRF